MGSKEVDTLPGVNRVERSGTLDVCFFSSPGTRSILHFAEHFLVFGLVIRHLSQC